MIWSFCRLPDIQFAHAWSKVIHLAAGQNNDERLHSKILHSNKRSSKILKVPQGSWL